MIIYFHSRLTEFFPFGYYFDKLYFLEQFLEQIYRKFVNNTDSSHYPAFSISHFVMINESILTHYY